MKKIVNLMINEYSINQYGLDFMGYVITNPKLLTFHHLIIPKKNGGKEIKENGVILLKKSHRYLHLIEKLDYSSYLKIKMELIEENKLGHISLININNINNILINFENNNNVQDIYKKRFLSEFSQDILDNIEKYELKKDLH